jgi:hypothetical protein
LVLVSLVLAVACRGEEHRASENTAASASAVAPPKLEAPAPTAPPSASAEEKRPTIRLYVRIPGAIQPLDRSDRFESPLDALLRERKLGEVKGGGSALKPGGGIEYVGIDIDVYDVNAALPVIAQQLRDVKAPKGTTIEELRDDEPAIQHRVW